MTEDDGDRDRVTEGVKLRDTLPSEEGVGVAVSVPSLVGDRDAELRVREGVTTASGRQGSNATTTKSDILIILKRTR